jgi:hypothetical protein
MSLHGFGKKFVLLAFQVAEDLRLLCPALLIHLASARLAAGEQMLQRLRSNWHARKQVSLNIFTGSGHSTWALTVHVRHPMCVRCKE